MLVFQLEKSPLLYNTSNKPTAKLPEAAPWTLNQFSTWGKLLKERALSAFCDRASLFPKILCCLTNNPPRHNSFTGSIGEGRVRWWSLREYFPGCGLALESADALKKRESRITRILLAKSSGTIEEAIVLFNYDIVLGTLALYTITLITSP